MTDKLDYVSIFYVFSALVLTMWDATMHQDSVSAIVSVLVYVMGATALAMRLALANIGTTEKVSWDAYVDEEEAYNIAISSAGGLMIIVVSSLVLSYLSEFETAFVLSVAVSEELFFRFFLLKLLRKQIGIVAHPVQAVLFALFHDFVYGTKELIIVFIAGLILGWLYERTGRISVSMTVHILNNLIASGVITGVA